MGETHSGACRGPLTDGDAAVGAAQVDVALGDGGHAQLVEGPTKEGGEGAGEHHVAVPHSAAHRHAHLRDGREGAKGNRWGSRNMERTTTLGSFHTICEPMGGCCHARLCLVTQLGFSVLPKETSDMWSRDLNRQPFLLDCSTKPANSFSPLNKK